MKSTFDKTQFTLYRYLAEEKMIVAVAKEYMPKIEHALKEFGNFKEVPSDWEVRGILIEPTKSKNVTFDPDAHQIEIIINCLTVYKPAA